MQINECDDARTWAHFDHMKANGEQSMAQNVKKKPTVSKLIPIEWNNSPRRIDCVSRELIARKRRNGKKTPTDREKRKKNVKSN